MSFTNKVIKKVKDTSKRGVLLSLCPVYYQYREKCENFWKGNHPQYGKVEGFEVARFRYFHTNADRYEKTGGMVILGFNPSGAYLSTKSKLRNGTIGTPSAFYEYDPFENGPIAIDPYTRAVEQFAADCGYADNQYKLDAFGIVEKTQSGLENKILKNPSLYEPVFELAISAIIKLEPKIVVFANAGLRRLIIDNGLFKNTITQLTWNSRDCVYNMFLKDQDNNSIRCNALFTTMLAGGHLDKGSRETIVQVIKNIP